MTTDNLFASFWITYLFFIGIILIKIIIIILEKMQLYKKYLSKSRDDHR